MARQSNTVVKVLGAGFAVIAGGAAFGYLFGSAHLPRPAEQTTSPTVSATLPLTSAPKLNPALIHPHTANGNYTAPGAPRITIEEQSQPILRRVAPPPAPAADPEASQEATVPPVKNTVPVAAPADAATSSSSGTGSISPSPDTSAGPATPAVSPPPSPPPAPADPDFERVNTPKPGASDPEAGQQGGSDKSQSGKSQTNNTPDSGVRAQFRVQTGAYADESNARTVADTLRSQGFTASTRSERDGDHLVYKVQVGAYRSKDGASKAADSLQKKGYSAFVSPMTP